MGEKTTNTNLASEFYVLSMLHRIGANAQLTLGNKKSVDITVEKQGKLLTIDVKGLRDKSNFPVDNCTKRADTHFIIFVCYKNLIADPDSMPDVFVVPSKELDKTRSALDGESLVYCTPDKKRKLVQYGRLLKMAKEFQNRWDFFV